MQLYQCHKKVRAEKIISIDRSVPSRVNFMLNDGSQRNVDIHELDDKPRPEQGMYFVQYLDNDYFSFSPTGVFEEGYSLIKEE